MARSMSEEAMEMPCSAAYSDHVSEWSAAEMREGTNGGSHHVLLELPALVL